MERADLAAAVERDTLEATLAAKLEELESAAHEHGDAGLASVRRAGHDGHEIVVRTTYEVTVDGEPFDVHLNVDNAGRVHYHGLPTRDFASVIDLVARVIDQFPGELGSGHGHGDHHDLGGGG